MSVNPACSLLLIALYACTAGTGPAPNNKAAKLFEQADTYRAAIEKDPKDAASRLGLVETYNTLGYYMEAYQQLQACIQSNPDQPDCLFQMATMLKGDGTRPGLLEAKRLFARFLSIAQPNHPKIEAAKGAIRALELQIAKAGSGGSGNAPHDAVHGGAAEAQGEGDEEDGEPSEPSADPHGATPPAADGAPDPAPVIAGHPGGGVPGQPAGELNAFGLALQKAIAAVRKNDPIAAEAGFKEALALRPDDPSAQSGLAQALLAQGKANEAMAAAEHAITLAPDDVETRWVYATILFQLRSDIPKAIDIFRGIQRDDAEYAKRAGVTKMLDMIDEAVKKNPQLRGKIEAPKKK